MLQGQTCDFKSNIIYKLVLGSAMEAQRLQLMGSELAVGQEQTEVGASSPQETRLKYTMVRDTPWPEEVATSEAHAISQSKPWDSLEPACIVGCAPGQTQTWGAWWIPRLATAGRPPSDLLWEGPRDGWVHFKAGAHHSHCQNCCCQVMVMATAGIWCNSLRSITSNSNLISVEEKQIYSGMLK